MKNNFTTDLEKFSIDNFIDAAIDLDWEELTRQCEERANWAKDYLVPRNEGHYRQKQTITLGFVRFLHDLKYILQNERPGIPRGMSFEVFSKLKPIIKKFVFSHKLDSGWLDIYRFVPNNNRLFSHMLS